RGRVVPKARRGLLSHFMQRTFIGHRGCCLRHGSSAPMRENLFGFLTFSMTTPGFKDAAGSVRLTSQGPPQTGRDRPVVILALEWETLSAAVEAEHFIIQIQPRHD